MGCRPVTLPATVRLDPGPSVAAMALGLNPRTRAAMHELDVQAPSPRGTVKR